MDQIKKFHLTGRRWIVPAVMAVMLVFYLFLAWSVPYSAIDDLQWGLDEGLHWLRDGSLNSRYVGNFFAVIMCRSQLVKTLILGLSTFFIPMLMARLAPLGGGGGKLPSGLSGLQRRNAAHRLPRLAGDLRLGVRLR